MRKITLQFENEYHGKYDTIKKEIDCEFQAGNPSLDNDQQIINIQTAIGLSLFDFVEKIGMDAEQFKLSLDTSFAIYQGDATEELELEDEYTSFVNKFLIDEEFKQKMFVLYQQYMLWQIRDLGVYYIVWKNIKI